MFMFCRLSTDVVTAGRLGPLHIIVQTGMQSAVHWLWFRLALSFDALDWVDGVMMTWFGPSENYVGFERRCLNKYRGYCRVVYCKKINWWVHFCQMMTGVTRRFHSNTGEDHNLNLYVDYQRNYWCKAIFYYLHFDKSKAPLDLFHKYLFWSLPYFKMGLL